MLHDRQSGSIGENTDTRRVASDAEERVFTWHPRFGNYGARVVSIPAFRRRRPAQHSCENNARPMNRSILFALLFIAVLPFVAAEADPAAPIHGYRITIAAGTSTESFTGSSPLSGDELSVRVTDPDPILLENRRDYFAHPDKNLPLGWHANADPPKIYILPHTVLYFEELSGDPAAKAK